LDRVYANFIDASYTIFKQTSQNNNNNDVWLMTQMHVIIMCIVLTFQNNLKVSAL